MSETQVATFGGGCFWCTEALFSELAGVERVVSGYSGGTTPDPTYRDVCRGDTGHAEVVQITFDPDVISYRDLLEIFWQTHDPTTLNRQGADIGTQYRSAVFYHNDEQKREAEELKDALNAGYVFPHPVVTEIAPAATFYPAEDYHQDYFAQNGGQPYCQAVIRPKLDKLRQAFSTKLKPS